MERSSARPRSRCQYVFSAPPFSPSPPAEGGEGWGEEGGFSLNTPAHEPQHRLTPSLSPAPSGGEGARRAGEGAVQGLKARTVSGDSLPVRSSRGEGVRCAR